MINLPRMAMGYVLLTAMAFALQLTYYQFAPTSWWFVYYGVIAVEPVQPGGPIRMVSRLERFRTTDMAYQDTLFCKEVSDDFGIYSIKQSEFDQAPRTNGLRQSYWQYDKPVPLAGVCKIRSVVRARLPYGMMSVNPQIVESAPFQIGKTQ